MSEQDPKPRTVLRRRDDLATAAVAASATSGLPRRTLVLIGLAIGVGVFAGLIVGAVLRDRDLEDFAYGLCREGNVPNAFIRTVDVLPADERARARGSLPILWCRRSAEVGHPVRLELPEEGKYLAIYRTGRLPLVDDDTGEVVGSEPFAAPRR